MSYIWANCKAFPVASKRKCHSEVQPKPKERFEFDGSKTFNNRLTQLAGRYHSLIVHHTLRYGHWHRLGLLCRSIRQFHRRRGRFVDGGTSSSSGSSTGGGSRGGLQAGLFQSVVLHDTRPLRPFVSGDLESDQEEHQGQDEAKTSYGLSQPNRFLHRHCNSTVIMLFSNIIDELPFLFYLVHRAKRWGGGQWRERSSSAGRRNHGLYVCIFSCYIISHRSPCTCLTTKTISILVLMPLFTRNCDSSSCRAPINHYSRRHES